MQNQGSCLNIHLLNKTSLTSVGGCTTLNLFWRRMPKTAYTHSFQQVVALLSYTYTPWLAHSFQSLSSPTRIWTLLLSLMCHDVPPDQIIGYLDRKFSLCTDKAVLLYVEFIGPEMTPKCLSSCCSFFFFIYFVFYSLFLIFMSLLY